MMRRNGGVGKVIAGVVVFFGAVYTIYLYNDLSGQLKNTERTAERYRREQESVSAQLQDLTVSKNELKQKCDNDREEMNNRLTSVNQQHKMLKSQHDELESEFSRLQSEHEREADEHRKLDDERTLEYNQFKQEKILEISNLKDSVANLEREKQQLNEEIAKFKTQLQNSLTQVTQDKQTIEQQQHDIEQYKALVTQDKQTIAQLQQQVQQQQFQLQQDRALINDYQGQLAHAQHLVQQANQQIQQQQNVIKQQQPAHLQNQAAGVGLQLGLQQGQNIAGLQQLQQGQNLAGDQQQQGGLGGGNQQRGFFQQENALPIVNQQQGVFQQNVRQAVQGGQQKAREDMNMNIAEEILQSLKDKHKPVDADKVEEEQKQHQILPPMDHDKMIDHRDDKGEKNDLHNEEGLGAGDDGHDNRLEHQGPVGLQVQEPRLKPDANHDDERKNLIFQPKLPDQVDNQIQPNQPVDDTIKQEQMDIMPVKPMPFGDQQGNNNIDRDDNLEREDEEEDDDNYDDPDDIEHENENEKEDDA